MTLAIRPTYIYMKAYTQVNNAEHALLSIYAQKNNDAGEKKSRYKSKQQTFNGQNAKVRNVQTRR